MTEGSKEQVPRHQTPLWSAVISGVILLVGGSVWGWVQSVLKDVPAGWIAAVVGLGALVALVVFVRPVRSGMSALVSGAWALRPVTWRTANRQALAVAQADQKLIATQDEVVEKQAEQLEAARAFITKQVSDHQVEIDRLTKAKEDAEEHLRLFLVEAESARQQKSELQMEVLDLRRLRTQIRDVTTKLTARATAAEERALAAEGDLKKEQDQTAALTQAATTHQKQLVEAFEKARKWEERAKAADAGQAKRDAIAEGGVSRLGGAEAAPSTPPPKPRWRVFAPEAPDEPWRLANLVPKSVTTRVRLESDETEFLINDAADWDLIVGGEGVPFEGELTTWGRGHGATLRLEWVDYRGTENWREIDIPAPYPEPSSPSVWSTGTSLNDTPF